MYTMEELKSWWEVPAIAHFFSLFKSCFSLTDFTIEELEEALMVDGEDDKATTFTSRLLTELLQGCFDNPGISVTSYHDALISIMKTRWEGEDGRVNPLSSINADFHSLPTLLKVQIIHRLTEYRLDAKDVATKLAGLNPPDLRLEPLGADHNGSNYWYFFGVRLYKETPPNKKLKKRKHEKSKKSNNKRAKYHDPSNRLNSAGPDEYEENNFAEIFARFTTNPSDEKHKKHKKKKQRKRKEEQESESSVLHGLSDGKWEVVCYNVEDWKLLARKLEDSGSRREDALCQLIIDNFLPNLPKIVEDMEFQKLQKMNVEAPRRSSCRLLAKKLYEEEDVEISLRREVDAREEKEEKRRNEENERLSFDFERMLQVEIERARKDSQLKWEKEQEEQRIKRLTEGVPILEEDDAVSSSSEEDLLLSSSETPTITTSTDNGIGSGSNRSLNQNKSNKPTEANKSKRKINPPEHKVESKMKIGDFEYAAMWKAWESLDSNEEAWPFQNPVEEWYAPGYHNIIKRPMDLSTIEGKLKKTEYKSVSTFKDDITLMFNNCRLYNGPDSEYTDVANSLDKMFQKSLQAELSQKPSNTETTSTNKSGRKQSNNAVKPPEKVAIPPPLPKTPPPPPVMEEAREYLDDEEMDEEDENESESSSSDEFTPPGVSKAQMKKRKQELKNMKEKKPKQATASRRSSTRKTSSDAEEQSVEEESDPEEDVAPVKTKTPPSTKGRKQVGRGRGNRVSQNRRSTKESESSDEEVAVKRVAKSRGRGGRRGRPSKGRGRGRRLSKAKASQSESSSGSEDQKEEVRNQFEDAENEKENEEEDRSATSKQESDVNNLVKSPKSNSNKTEKIEAKSEKKNTSFSRDRESSSSSSPASSRSHSLEKFEKLEEDAKSKPQVLWSLDYLASQARVLEERHRRTESSSSGKSTFARRQSSDAYSNRSISKSGDKKSSEDSASSQKPRSKQKSDVATPATSKTKPGNKVEDIYSFHDDESPNSSSHPVKTSSASPAASTISSPSTSSHNFNSPHSLTQNSKAGGNKALDSKLRRNSVEHMSPPQTPSSGYSSSKSLSNSSNQYLSSSPYTDANKGTENKVPAKNGQQKSTPDQSNSPFAPQAGYQASKASAAYSTPTSITPIPSSPQNQNGQHRPPVVPAESHVNVNQRSYSLPGNSNNPMPTFPPSSKTGTEAAKSVVSTAGTDNRYHAPLQHSASIPYLNTTTQQQHNATDQQSSLSNRRHSQPHIPPLNMKSPDTPVSSYQHSKTNLNVENNKNCMPQNDMSTQRPLQQQRGSNYPTQNHPPSNLSNPAPHNHPARHNVQSRGYDMVQRTSDNYISSSASNQQQYNYGKSTQALINSTSSIVASRDNSTKYHHDSISQQQHQNRNTNNSMQQQDPTMPTNYEPTMATFGLTPWSLSQPGQSGADRGNQGNAEPGSSQRKLNSSTGYSVPKPNNNNNIQQQQQAHSRLQQQQSYHSSSAASGSSQKSQPPAPTPSPHQHNQSAGSHHPSSGSKSRPPNSNPGSGASPGVGGSGKQRQASSTSSQGNPPDPGMSGHSRRTSGNSSQPLYQKSHSHYGYHIPPTPAPTPGGESQTTGYSPHQQNGLLSATNNNAALLHQDLTASATLRALQQQHKTDHSSHAAASMFHYAAAVQQSQDVVAAANEKYNRLAAHHRATPQHGHPLAGVYHPHHQNAVTSTHQAAAHLSTPWLQAAAAAPTAGYPGNLLSHAAHMDPVYQHLMQQSGMHGQYPMYPNHVMQQLHQQHLQHHMLPKY